MGTLDNKSRLLCIDEYTVVHCPTIDLAKQVCDIVHKLGFKYNSEDSYRDLKYSEKERQCYNFHSGLYSHIGFYKESGYKIMPAEEFINLHKSCKEMEENKRVYYQGDPKRCNEIIKALENLGGINFSCAGSDANNYYFIGKNNKIHYISRGANGAWLLEQLYTKAELPTIPEKPIETIQIGVYTYNKAEIEKALEKIKPINIKD